MEQAEDEDNDGIPDKAPALPMDEERFGSDAGKADSDADGISDKQKRMATQWMEH